MHLLITLVLREHVFPLDEIVNMNIVKTQKKFNFTL